MISRATSQMTNANSLLYMQRNFSSLSKVEGQIGSWKQVVEIDDNPLAANVGIKLNSVIAKVNQYNTTIGTTGLPTMKYNDGLLASMKVQADKMSSLVINAAQSATSTAATRANDAVQMKQILQSLVAYGNQNDGTRYVFGGTHSTSTPFNIVNGKYVNYTGNSDNINLLVDNGTAVPINLTGTDIFGNLETTIASKNMNPGVNLTTDHSTKLSDLNGGQGIPKGKITISYSAYPNGLEVDLSKCDSLEDVKDTIEKATLEASKNLNLADCPWLNPQSLDWHDLQDRYVKVSVNAEGNGLSLQEIDLGEELPQPSALEKRHGLKYSGEPGYPQNGGGLGVADGSDKPVVVYDKKVTSGVYANRNAITANDTYAALKVDDNANNKVAEGLGIKGSAKSYNPLAKDQVLDGKIEGRDLNPKLSTRTLLADLDGYNDSVYTFTNGSKDTGFNVTETSKDVNNVFNAWNLSGLAIGQNTGKNGELYAKAVNKGTYADPDIHIELYTQPLDKARPSDLVASGTFTQNGAGGTVVLEQANASGLSGTVGLVLSPSVGEAEISLKVATADNMTASVYVPAFIEETENGVSKDVFNIASGWNLTGLDKPPASGHDLNHAPSTDLDGNVSVNYRYDSTSNSFRVELSRPAYDNVPAALIATGSIKMPAGFDPTQGLDSTLSGRIQFVPEEGFENVGGSVYIELPAGTSFADTTVGADKNHPTTNTYALTSSIATNAIITLGGAMELKNDLNLANGEITLSQDTTFLKGQTFTADVLLPNGGRIAANTPLDRDVTIPAGLTLKANTIQAGTVLQEGQVLDGGDFDKGTVIPRGTYMSALGFPAGGMSMTVTTVNPDTGLPNPNPQSVNVAGYDVKATFATIEDFNRAVEEAGIYLRAEISADGKGLEFKSSLAGAWLTVSEDTDCYEQLGDVYQQLSSLNLNGLTKGLNADTAGNVYQEVVYYPPNPNSPDHKIHLTGKDGQSYDLEPGYYVRVYSDPEQMNLPFEDRDNSKMVAEGFLGMKDSKVDGYMTNLVLEERNHSGVNGTVNLDYYNGNPKSITNPDGSENYNYRDNSGITVYPGGMRNTGSAHTTLQEIDLYNPTPGVNCDYAGTFHGAVTSVKTDIPAAGDYTPEVTLYRDSQHKTPVAKSDPKEMAGPDGKVTLYEVDKYGAFTLTNPNDPTTRVPVGTMTIAQNKLPAGASDSFSVTPGGNRNTGQKREDNIFSTINDVIDALHANDDETLHNILGRVEIDVQRTVDARGLNGARQQRMEMLSERHLDDIARYQATLTSRVGMDDAALAEYSVRWQAATNAFNAAMQVSSKIMQMSLLQYI